MAEKRHVFEEKLTKGEDIDEDVLLESFKRNENNSLRILLGLYKGQYFKLFMAVLLFAVKHTPVWVLPIATANIILVMSKGNSTSQKLYKKNDENSKKSADRKSLKTA